jgi:hypothetical protein
VAASSALSSGLSRSRHQNQWKIQAISALGGAAARRGVTRRSEKQLLTTVAKKFDRSFFAPHRISCRFNVRLFSAESALHWHAANGLWGVLQDRLTSELRLAQATNIASANTVLRKFIADYNRRFARQARESATAWRETPDTLDRICCFVHERIVSNDNVVQWEGRRFQIPQQARRFSFAGAKVRIYQALDGRISLYYGETRLQLAAMPGG